MSNIKSSESLKNEIADRLIAFFDEKNINQKEFCLRTGYSKAQASAVFNKNTNFGEKLIKVIALSFSISEQWIKTGEGERDVDKFKEFSITRHGDYPQKKEVGEGSPPEYKPEGDHLTNELLRWFYPLSKEGKEEAVFVVRGLALKELQSLKKTKHD